MSDILSFLWKWLIVLIEIVLLHLFIWQMLNVAVESLFSLINVEVKHTWIHLAACLPWRAEAHWVCSWFCYAVCEYEALHAEKTCVWTLEKCPLDSPSFDTQLSGDITTQTSASCHSLHGCWNKVTRPDASDAIQTLLNGFNTAHITSHSHSQL